MCSLSYAVYSIIEWSSFICVLISSRASLSSWSFALSGRKSTLKCPRCLHDGDVLVLSFHRLYFPHHFFCSNGDGEFMISDGSQFPSSIASSDLLVFVPHPIVSITACVTNRVFSACWKWRMFLLNISYSIVGPSVIGMYSSSMPSFGRGTSMEDIPPGQFIFDGSSDIICFVSFAR
jgi:hypothetical protein